MNKANKIFLSALLALSLGVTMMGCSGKKAEPTSSSEHVHNYAFDKFMWTETPGAYTAKARLICAEDSASKEVDATMTKTHVDQTCGVDGYNDWKASYDGHEETKREGFERTDLHHHTAAEQEVDGVAGAYYVTCDVCGQKIYHVTYSTYNYYFTFEVTKNPSANEDGTINVRFLDYDSVGKSFAPHTQTEPESTTDPKNGVIPIDSFIENGSNWVINEAESKLSYRNYMCLMKYHDNIGLGLAASQNFAKVVFAEWDFVYTVTDLASLAPEMKYNVNIYAGASWGSYYTGSTLLSFKAARKDGITFPTEGDPIVRSGYQLSGYATESGGAVVNEPGAHIDIPMSQNGVINRYCVWAAL